MKTSFSSIYFNNVNPYVYSRSLVQENTDIIEAIKKPWNNYYKIEIKPDGSNKVYFNNKLIGKCKEARDLSNLKKESLLSRVKEKISKNNTNKRINIPENLSKEVKEKLLNILEKDFDPQKADKNKCFCLSLMTGLDLFNTNKNKFKDLVKTQSVKSFKPQQKPDKPVIINDKIYLNTMFISNDEKLNNLYKNI